MIFISNSSEVLQANTQRGRQDDMTDGEGTGSILWTMSRILETTLTERSVEVQSSLLHRRYSKRLKTQTSCRHYCIGSIIFLQVGSVSLVHSERWSMVKTFHIKGYVSDLIQSNEVIWSNAKITFVSINWINSKHFFVQPVNAISEY